ncbi:hypothetical protein L228DRAFT_269271 [Xylona heveae TC161]|uniref:Zn(2)-C6 fungal-type domain-containing protein n=1 Tax=Xylona heveae (strain CBS 132557 / TC161) TaxID=1328760 RepID=A0A165G742_XYLHT|nr:hypothetical protein L228DRAFT_269271 [Xylona heveae TC161]KZF21817.1 hypothetical protein L228DRAFT_269271 [Xylona heveae TC161]
MVYCGKPSGACQTCKNRRIKCDEARPACSQCRKSKRQCPGYKSSTDLIFRDETQATERRAQLRLASTNARRPLPGAKPSAQGSVRDPAAPQSSSAGSLFDDAGTSSGESSTNQTSLVAARDRHWSSPSSNSSASSSSSSWWTAADAFSVLYQVPGQPAEHQALTFFFSSCILPTTIREREADRGFLQHVLPVYNQVSTGSALSLATAATAFAVLGNRPGQRGLAREARVRYGEALALVNQAIRDPVQAKSDALLLCVLLFGLYEATTCTSQSITSFDHHLDGAVALIKYRGKEQTKNPHSLKLFLYIREQMLANCIQKAKPLDDFPFDWGEYPPEANVSNELTAIARNIPNLRIQANGLLSEIRTPQVVARVRELLSAAQALDAEIAFWADSLPPEWCYHTVLRVKEPPEDTEDAEVYAGDVDAYPDVWVANFWNSYRCHRIFILEVKLRCLMWLAAPNKPSPMTFPDIVPTLKYASQMVQGICSSVPYCLRNGPFTPFIQEQQSQHYLHHYQRYNVTELNAEALNADTQTSDSNDDESFTKDTSTVPPPPPNTTSAYLLLRPLFIAVRLPWVPEQQAQWMRGRMRYIARTFGANFAELPTISRNFLFTGRRVFKQETPRQEMPPEKKSSAGSSPASSGSSTSSPPASTDWVSVAAAGKKLAAGSAGGGPPYGVAVQLPVARAAR